MTPLKLEIDNFLTIGSASLNLSGQGLVAIQGENLCDTSATSNGVGKSSIVDALCWCNYGETARDESGDTVVNSKAGKDARVRTLWEDGATLYSITRHRKHAKHKNQTLLEISTDGGATWADLSKGTEKDTQVEIDKIIGCTLNVFKGSIYAGQEDAPDLPKMTDKQLKMLVEEAAGVEKLESAYKIASTKVTALKTILSVVTTKIGTNKTNLERAKVDLASSRISFDAFEKERPDRVKAQEHAMYGIANDMRAMAEKIKSSGDAEKRARLEEVKTILAEHSKRASAVDDLNFKANDYRRIYERAFANLNHEVENTKRIKLTLTNAAEEMKKPCLECGKPHTDAELDEYRAHLKKRLEEAVGVALKIKATAEEAKAKLDGAVKAHADALAALPDVSDLAAEQVKLNSELNAIERQKMQIIARKKDFERAKELVEAEKVKPNPHAATIEMLQKRISEIEVGIATDEAELKVAEEDLEVAESVAQVFSPAGVRAHILDTVTPFLNDRTADYLSALSDGNISAVWTTLGETAKGELREKFNIAVKNEKGGGSFGLISGGEKRKVRLATMLALQDLVASRATKPINLYIGDEIDDALDPAGLERLMTILERKARERGTVLIVSHNDLADWCDNVCTVTKHPSGVSTVSGALTE